MNSDVLTRLTAARSEVISVCNGLLSPSPEALDGCASLLERAVGELETCRRLLERAATGHPELEQARGLRTDLRRARHLLQNASSYYSGWQRLLGTMSGGYTACGSPAQLALPARVCLQG
jgi:hypothetical protein